MDRRQFVALGALGVVGAGLGGLIVTGRDDGSGHAAPADPTSPTGSTAADSTAADSTAADPTTTDAATAEPGADLPDRGPHPPLVGIDGWLQSDIESLEELRGRVVAVQFWTFGCFNCRNTMPHMRALHDRYAGADFEIVGVHAPEFEREKDAAAIAEAAAEQGIVWPIALDTEKRSFRSWQTERRFWPRLYLLDRRGHVRFDTIGEGRYDEIDAAVAALIAEPSGDGDDPAGDDTAGDDTAGDDEPFELPANVWPPED